MLLHYPLHSNAREITNLPRCKTRFRISVKLIRLQAWFWGEKEGRLDRNVLDSHDVYKEVHESHPDKTDYRGESPEWGLLPASADGKACSWGLGASLLSGSVET